VERPERVSAEPRKARFFAVLRKKCAQNLQSRYQILIGATRKKSNALVLEAGPPLFRLFRREGEKRKNAGAFDRFGNDPLMLGTSPRDAARENLAPLGDETAQGVRVLVINFEFLSTKPANFLLEENFAPSAAAPIFLAAVSAVFATAFTVFIKRPTAPTIRSTFASSGLRVRFARCGFDCGRHYFCLLIRHILLLIRMEYHLKNDRFHFP
jgi:hypothetical protein